MFFYKGTAYVFCIVLITAVGLYCYNPFQLYFQNDDFVHISLSAHGKMLQHNSFRPLCDISIMMDYVLWGKSAAGYHLTNLLLHMICCSLVFIFSVQLLQNFFVTTQKRAIAATAAFLFFAYPFHSEAVFWILGRSAILGTLFSLLFLIFYLKKTSGSTVLSYLFFVLALLSYESSWMLPLFCWVLFIVERTERKSFVGPVALSVLFFVYLCFRYLFINEIVGNYEGANFMHLNIRNLGTNFIKLFLRSFLPPFDNDVLIAAFGIILLALVVLFFTLKKDQKIKVLLLIIFFLASLVPYSSIGISVYGTEAERFLYFPSAILCFITSYIIYTSLTSVTIRNSVVIFIFLFYCSVLFQNAIDYRLAGSVVKTFIGEVNQLRHKNILYLEQLPQSKNGALILRQGALEAVKWLGKPNTVDSVIVCSEKDEITGFKNYGIIIKNLSKSDPGCGSLTEKDAVFYFTDSALIVYK